MHVNCQLFYATTFTTENITTKILFSMCLSLYIYIYSYIIPRYINSYGTGKM